MLDDMVETNDTILEYKKGDSGTAWVEWEIVCNNGTGQSWNRSQWRMFVIKPGKTCNWWNKNSSSLVAEAITSSWKILSVFSCICEAQQEDKAWGETLPFAPSRGNLLHFPSTKEEKKKERLEVRKGLGKVNTLLRLLV